MKLAGIILAAGESRRMGMPKALLTYQGETLLDRWIRLFSPCCSEVIAVLGRQHDFIRARIQQGGCARLIINPAPERGQFSSLKCALQQLPEEAAGFMFTPVDYPSVRASTVAALAAAFRATGSPVVMPRYGGRAGHPVCCARAIAEEMLREPDDSQARIVLRRHAAEVLYVDVPDQGILVDVDDPQAYARLLGTER